MVIPSSLSSSSRIIIRIRFGSRACSTEWRGLTPWGVALARCLREPRLRFPLEKWATFGRPYSFLVCSPTAQRALILAAALPRCRAGAATTRPCRWMLISRGGSGAGSGATPITGLLTQRPGKVLSSVPGPWPQRSRRCATANCCARLSTMPTVPLGPLAKRWPTSMACLPGLSTCKPGDSSPLPTPPSTSATRPRRRRSRAFGCPRRSWLGLTSTWLPRGFLLLTYGCSRGRLPGPTSTRDSSRSSLRPLGGLSPRRDVGRRGP